MLEGVPASLPALVKPVGGKGVAYASVEQQWVNGAKEEFNTTNLFFSPEFLREGRNVSIGAFCSAIKRPYKMFYGE